MRNKWKRQFKLWSNFRIERCGWLSHGYWSEK